MENDRRASIYADLHGGQLAREESQNRHSAREILSILLEYAKPASVLDVGCGRATWLAVAQELGAKDVLGIDGEWLDTAAAGIDATKLRKHDLEKPISLGRQFDLVICLEVAEHLSPGAADTLVKSLVAHGPLVLFSAAIPFQGGHHHVNEQFADYWASRFGAHGYVPLDCIRPRIWSDSRILWWLRQNIVLYARESLLQHNARLREEHATRRMLSVVHPDVYLSRMREADAIVTEHRKLLAVLAQGGTFSVEHRDGQLSVTKVR